METRKTKQQLYWQAAISILFDECPPDNKFYYCRMGEEPENECKTCWMNYLWFIANGFNPYERASHESDL